MKPKLACSLPRGISAAERMEALTVTVRYKGPDGNLRRLIEVPLKDEARAVECGNPRMWVR
jgi:hypothetical protein